MTRYLLAELADADGLEKAVFDTAEKMEANASWPGGDILAVHHMRSWDPCIFAWRLTGLRVLDEDVHYWLQGLYPKGWHDDKRQEYLPLPEDTWMDVLSVGSWKDPEKRAAALEEFRRPDPDGERHPAMCKAWRMVCRIRTEIVLTDE